MPAAASACAGAAQRSRGGAWRQLLSLPAGGRGGLGWGRTVRFCRARRTKVSTRLTAISLSSPANAKMYARGVVRIMPGDVGPLRGMTPAHHLSHRRGPAVPLPCAPDVGSSMNRTLGFFTSSTPTAEGTQTGQATVHAVAQGMQSAGSQGEAVVSFKGGKGSGPRCCSPLKLSLRNAVLESQLGEQGCKGRRLTGHTAALAPGDPLHAQNLISNQGVLAALKLLSTESPGEAVRSGIRQARVGTGMQAWHAETQRARAPRLTRHRRARLAPGPHTPGGPTLSSIPPCQLQSTHYAAQSSASCPLTRSARTASTCATLAAVGMDRGSLSSAAMSSASRTVELASSTSAGQLARAEA